VNKKETLRVCEKACDQCLYGKNKIVSDQRKEEILRTLEATQDYFVCHKASVVDEKVMCSGYYHANKNTSVLIQLATHLGLLRFVNVLEVMRTKISRRRKKVHHI
jgi:hypothetical protein